MAPFMKRDVSNDLKPTMTPPKGCLAVGFTALGLCAISPTLTLRLPDRPWERRTRCPSWYHSAYAAVLVVPLHVT